MMHSPCLCFNCLCSTMPEKASGGYYRSWMSELEGAIQGPNDLFTVLKFSSYAESFTTLQNHNSSSCATGVSSVIHQTNTAEFEKQVLKGHKRLRVLNPGLYHFGHFTPIGTKNNCLLWVSS